MTELSAARHPAGTMPPREPPQPPNAPEPPCAPEPPRAREHPEPRTRAPGAPSSANPPIRAGATAPGEPAADGARAAGARPSPTAGDGTESLPARAGRHAAPDPRPRPGFGTAVAAVYTGQLARARIARVPLLFVAGFQSLGILLLLRGVVGKDVSHAQVVAGATVLVVAFVGLNLLAQRFGALKASGALDYYGALGTPGTALVLGAAGAYATFAIPGAILTAVLGAALYQLPMTHLWLVLPAGALAGASLAGLGALVGLWAPKAELATVAGQLGMSAVLFLDIIPVHRLPGALRVLRAAIPSTYAADLLAAGLHARMSVQGAWVDVAVSLAVGVACLGLARLAYDRALRR